jgi:hypothetical protein
VKGKGTGFITLRNFFEASIPGFRWISCVGIVTKGVPLAIIPLLREFTLMLLEREKGNAAGLNFKGHSVGARDSWKL